MAFATGEECAYTQPAANADYAERNGNFLFGVIAVIAAAADVLWSDGKLVTDIPLVALDKIVPESSGGIGVGAVVRMAGATSPEYDAIVLRVYTRQPQGTQGTGGPFALLQVLGTGLLIEALVSTLEAVTGR
jgi:hypothetical protein